MSFAKDVFDGVQAKMKTSIDEFERLEVGVLLRVSCKCACVCSSMCLSSLWSEP